MTTFPASTAIRAAVMRGPGSLALELVDDADPAPGHAVLEIALSGICGTDKHTYRGESLQYAGTPHERQIDYPLICGHENVGRLAALGREARFLDVDGRPLQVGDRVVPAANVTCGECWYCTSGRPYFMCERLEDYGNSLTRQRPPGLFGGWAERMHVLPGTRLFRVPDELPDEVAVMTEPMAVTHGLDSALGMTASGGGFRPGDTVAVLGAGPLGICHLAKAAMLGAGRLIASDAFDLRLGLAARFGAELGLSVARTTSEERVDLVRQATAGRGADVVVDCTGGADALLEAIAMLRTGGTLIEPGAFVDVGDAAINVSRDLCHKSILVIGVGGETLPAYQQSLRLMTRHLDRLPLAEIVSHVFALERAREGIELSQTGAATKVALAPALR